MRYQLLLYLGMCCGVFSCKTSRSSRPPQESGEGISSPQTLNSAEGTANNLYLTSVQHVKNEPLNFEEEFAAFEQALQEYQGTSAFVDPRSDSDKQVNY